MNTIYETILVSFALGVTTLCGIALFILVLLLIRNERRNRK